MGQPTQNFQCHGLAHMTIFFRPTQQYPAHVLTTRLQWGAFTMGEGTRNVLPYVEDDAGYMYSGRLLLRCHYKVPKSRGM